MGIPRLKGHLERYSQSGRLGRCIYDCQAPLSSTVVIDGPSLAYHIYSRLVALQPQQAQPSYQELGEAVLNYLCKLEDANVDVAALFFDGFLPESKRSIRLERLQGTLTQLIKLRASHPLGLKTAGSASGSHSATCNAEDLFSLDQGNKSIWSSLNGPFVVPVVLDALRSSRFASKLKVVPGEADAYCAEYVRQHGGVVLSNDSDLAVYDLGKGALAFFESLSLSRCDLCAADTVMVKTLNPIQIARKLQVPSLARFAFAIKQDRTITAGMAILKAAATLRPVEVQRYQEFCREYGESATNGIVSSSNIAMLEQLQSLDPRVAEFVLQARFGSSTSLHAYTPVLLEDPGKASAWKVSASTRAFSYSSFLLSCPRTAKVEVWEYSRQENCISPFQITLMDQSQCIAFAEKLDRQIVSFKQEDDINLTVTLWRVFSAALVALWYIERGQAVPTLALEQTLNGKGSTGTWSWTVIHFDAQMQAYLYSFRQVKQLLQHSDLSSMHLAFGRVSKHLESLPAFEVLLRSSPRTSKQSPIKVKEIENFAKSLAHSSGSSVGEDGDEATGQPDAQDDELWKTHKSRKKRTKAKEDAKRLMPAQPKAKKSAPKSNNMYGLLEGLT